MSDSIFSRLKKGQNDIFVMCYLKLLLVQNSHFENQVWVNYSSPIEPNSRFHSLKHSSHKMASTLIPIATKE